MEDQQLHTHSDANISSNSEPVVEPQASSSSSTSASSSASPPSAPTFKCDACAKPESPEKPLKPCAKCQSVRYCSRDCQKADFKVHKKTCAKQAQIYAQTADLKMATTSAPKKDGHRGGLQKWQFDT